MPHRPLFYFFLFLYLAYFPTIKAQIGFKAGPSISDIAFKKDGQTPYLGYEIDLLEHRIPLSTFQIGAFATFPTWKKLELQPELLFISQGLDYSTNYLFDEITYKINIHYLHLPLLIQYKMMPDKTWHLGFLTGPYGSLKLNANRTTILNGEKEKSKLSRINKTDFGIIVGCSADFDLANAQLTLDLRGSYSLVNMMDKIAEGVPWYYSPTESYARNVSFAFTIGYRFLNLWPKNSDKS